MRRAGDSGLGGIAHRSFPKLFSRSRINRDPAAIPRAHVDHSIPHRHAAIGSRGIGTIDGQVQPNLGIKPPQQLSRSRIHGIHHRQRGAHISDAIDDNRFGNDAHATVNVQKPGQAKAADILVGDLF